MKRFVSKYGGKGGRINKVLGDWGTPRKLILHEDITEQEVHEVLTE